MSINLNPAPPKVETGFPVLKLPKRGEQLIPGRQYELSPVARAAIKHMYGFDAPRVVECIDRDRPALCYRTLVYREDNGLFHHSSVLREPATQAAFKAFLGYKRIERFELDLSLLAEEELKYKGSHLAREIEETLPKSAKKTKKTQAEIKREVDEAIEAFDVNLLL